MAGLAREKKLATQMGTQGMASDRAQPASRSFGPGCWVTSPSCTSGRIVRRVGGPRGWIARATRPSSSNLDWNLWLGVAPAGSIIPRIALSPGGDGRISATAPRATWASTTRPCRLPHSSWRSEPRRRSSRLRSSRPRRFRPGRGSSSNFGLSGRRGPVTLYWYDGGQKPPAELLGGHKLADNGAIVVGTNGTLSSVEWTGGEWAILPRIGFAISNHQSDRSPRAPGQSHHQEWLAACRGGAPAFCRFDGFASQLTETMLVANLALRTGRKITWNAETMEAQGCPEASAFIKRAYRTGW